MGLSEVKIFFFFFWSYSVKVEKKVVGENLYFFIEYIDVSG